MIIPFQDISKLILEHNNFLILTHRAPDGDTLGSAYALQALLEKLNKTAYVLHDETVPKKYQFMLEGRGEMPEGFLPDYIIAVDIAEVKLLGKRLELYGDKIDLCIDHHISNSGYAKNTYVDAKAAATGEIIYDIAMAMGIALDIDIARNLYVSIVCDTGCFKFSNTTSKTMVTASELIKFGFDFTLLLRNLFDLKTKGQIELEKLILDTLELYDDGKIAVICITSEMMKQTGTSGEDLEGFAQLPRYIAGTMVGITIKQCGDKLWRISLRSSGLFDASKACAVHGGGGHPRAAGCEISGTMEFVKDQIIDTAKSFLESANV